MEEVVQFLGPEQRRDVNLEAVRIIAPFAADPELVPQLQNIGVIPSLARLADQPHVRTTSTSLCSSHSPWAQNPSKSSSICRVLWMSLQRFLLAS